MASALGEEWLAVLPFLELRPRVRFAEVGRVQLEVSGKDRLEVLDQHDADLTASQVTLAAKRKGSGVEILRCADPALARFCPRLIELDVCFHPVKRLPALQLVTLRVEACPITDEALDAFFDGGGSAENLHARACEQLEGSRWCSGPTVTLDVDGCFRLRPQLLGSEDLLELRVDGQDWTDYDFAPVLRRSPRLRRLHVSFCEQFGDAVLSALEAFGDWEELRLRKSNFSDAGWARLLGRRSAGTGLGELRNASCSENALIGPAVALLGSPRLTILDLSWCWKVRDEDVSKILRVSPNLRDANLAGLDVRVSPALLPELCPKLEALDCRHTAISDEVLSFLVHGYAPRAPRILNYYGEEPCEWARLLPLTACERVPDCAAHLR